MTTAFATNTPSATTSRSEDPMSTKKKRKVVEIKRSRWLSAERVSKINAKREQVATHKARAKKQRVEPAKASKPQPTSDSK